MVLPKARNLLDEASHESLAKIREHQASTKGAYPVDNEWMVLAEWLKIAGYQAYLDAKNDARDENGNLKVTMTEILTLISANRKLERVAQYYQSEAEFIGACSARASKPLTAFKSMTKNIIKEMKV